MGSALKKTKTISSTQRPFWLEVTDTLGKVLIGVFGIIISILIAYQQLKTSRDIENLRTQLSESQLAISRSQFAAGLIEPLIRGSESERITAMILLESAVDSLAFKIFEGLALYDFNVFVRLQAIRALGRKGSGDTAKRTLAKIQKEGKTEAERQTAKIAEKEFRFRENLKTARVFLNQGRQGIAAQYFYEASKYVDSTQIDISLLLEATSLYNRGGGGFELASIKFDSVFSKLYPNEVKEVKHGSH